MKKKELAELKKLDRKWMNGKATIMEIMRCRVLRTMSRLAERPIRNDYLHSQGTARGSEEIK